MTLKSIGAVLIGLLALVVLASVTDTALQWRGVYPVTGEKRFESWQSLLALSYHVPLMSLGCYLAARFAPGKPVAHAMALGAICFVMSVLGQIAIMTRDLAPEWYGWTLIALSFPLAWVSGRLAKSEHRDSDSDAVLRVPRD